MNNTEIRLRDYLQAKASTVPDNAEPPGLHESAVRRRPVWPALMAAAAIAAVLVSTVPLLNRLGDNEVPVNESTSLTVPYYLTDLATDRTTLHDGSTTVTVPKDVFRILGRVAGGWAATMEAPRPGGGIMQRLGVLQEDGKLRSFGPRDGDYATLSPDRLQMAVAEPLGSGRTRVATYDVASGRQMASVTLTHQSTILYGWNRDGIWLAEDYKVGAQPSVWQPSDGRLTPLSVRGFDLRLVAPSGSGRVLVQVRPQPEKWCMQAARLVNGRLTVDREYCGSGGRMVYPTISPDGGTLLLSEHNLAVDVATGRETTIRAPYRLETLPSPVFEDATHVLSVFHNTSSPTPDPTPSILTPGPDGATSIRKNLIGRDLKDRSVYRCDVTDGSCARAYDVPDDQTMSLVQP